MSQLVPVLVVSPFIIGYYSYQSNAIAGYRGPLAVVGFFVLATIINLLLMRPVARWTYELERQEGNFRYLGYSYSVGVIDLIGLYSISNTTLYN